MHSKDAARGIKQQARGDSRPAPAHKRPSSCTPDAHCDRAYQPGVINAFYCVIFRHDDAHFFPDLRSSNFSATRIFALHATKGLFRISSGPRLNDLFVVEFLKLFSRSRR